MFLCQLCRTIPFDSLPRFPTNTTAFKVDSEIYQLRWDNGGRDVEPPPDPLGFSWHKSLDALARSARSGCPLCILAQKGVEVWIGHCQEHVGKPNRVKGFLTLMVPQGQTLWLTQRFGNGAGFVVLVRDPSRAYAVNLVAGVGFAVDAGGPLARKFPLRPHRSYSGSWECLDVAADWLADCASSHEECRSGTDQDPPLPSRVLDVGARYKDCIKLLETDGRTGKYVCLSHCWGSSTPLTTTRASYGERLSEICLSELPRTFLDAVIVTRHLRLRYLWIDCLCICQDDVHDWARESTRMGGVYSQAHLVIAANHSKDSDGGCFHARNLHGSLVADIPGIGEVYAQQLPHKYEYDISLFQFDEQPLSARGWTMQERVLAKRVLHYHHTQMFFECNSGIIGENGCAFFQRDCDLTAVRAIDRPLDRVAIHWSWYLLLQAFSGRKLTKATDKLPAISGLAALFAARLGAEYVAGLWSDRLIHDLTWQRTPQNTALTSQVYLGPSWSWVPHGHVHFAEPNELMEVVGTLESWHVKVRNEENQFGDIENAWLCIRAPVAEVLPSHDQTFEGPRGSSIRFRTSGWDTKEDVYVRLDYRNTEDEWREWQIFVMLLLRYKERSYNSDCSWGLVLVSAEEDEQGVKMKRVGTAFINVRDTSRMIADDSCWKVVTLV